MNDPQFDEDFAEVTQDHIDQVIAAIKADPDDLFDFFAQSEWWKEHAMFLYDQSEQFRDEIARSERVANRAQDLADSEARQKAEEAAYERAESLRDCMYER